MKMSPLALLCVWPLALAAAENKPLFDSGVITKATPGHAKTADVDIAGKKELYLLARDGGDGFGCDWADWAEPRLVRPKGELPLTSLKWKSATTGFGEVRVNANAAGQPLSINEQAVASGIGTHANSLIVFDLPEGHERFRVRVGLDSGGTKQGCGSSVQFLIFAEKPADVWLRSASDPIAESERTPETAVGNLDVANGFEAKLFAAEPMLKNPSNIDIDHRGRVWVCEVVNYRRFANKGNPDRPEGDRILVLEDTDGDSVADKQTVFYQGTDVDSAHGICVLGDRVIISCGDSIFSLYDRDGDLKADPGSKELLFTGIGGTQHDHGVHAVVFGPDGKLYFNFGNSGGQLKDKNGQPIVDKAGNEINSSRKPYQEGMVFRCNLDGSEVETLGWNFRNNWEVAVDSFGTLWQSDNDDDGNRGVRINYVMEFGNYGYRDEINGAGWREPRTNLEKEIPLQHWHLNDPGVVPNVLQTGAGSPTGICVYEGDLLPEVFRNQLIHCDAGPSVVRAYITQPDGAGYKAEMVNILQGARDNWFRPSDVCVAPDGSLIVADWYDPGVGGHRQGDADRGRLFRVAPAGTKYAVPKVDVTTLEGALAALRSPNQATRYLAWTAIHRMGMSAAPALMEVVQKDPNPRMRARAYWLLSKVPNLTTDTTPLAKAARQAVWSMLNADVAPSEEFRVLAVRALRQLDPAQTFLPMELINSPALRRELAIMLHGTKGATADSVWVRLAQQHNPADRWELEAIGIGADGNWDERLAAYLRVVPDAAQTPAGRNILWRSRAAQTPMWLAKALQDPLTPPEEQPRLMRAFDFTTGPEKTAALEQLAFGAHREQLGLFVVAEALERLPTIDLSKEPAKAAVVKEILDAARGTPQYLALIERFQVKDRYSEVLALIQQQPTSQFAVDAMKMLVKQPATLQAALTSDDPVQAAAVARALGLVADNRAVALLTPILDDSSRLLAVRQEAAKSLAKSKPGVAQLLQRAKADQLTDDIRPAVAFALQNANFPEYRQEIVQRFPLPPSRNDQPLPPLEQLYQRKGDANRGKVAFNTVGKCNTCHVVRNEGKEVGPNLSEIGSKLSREAMFESILYPSAGISHNYETWTAVTEDGNSVTGLLVSQTPAEIQLKGADGLVRTLARADLEDLVKQPVSLMPADLQKTMTVEELVDVVEYLNGLRK